MMIKPINTKTAHKQALKRIEDLWDAEPKTPEGDELDVLATLVSAYEDQHFPISKPEPVEAIKFRMDQMGLADKDLVPFIGARSKVSEVLNLKRALSLPMIRKLSQGLNIPSDSLIKKYSTSS
jgi:HTH-type transcriptional regulator/antitoxin HigA